MKKLIVALFASVSLAAGVFAQATTSKTVYPREEKRTLTPVVLSFHGEETIDIIGLRLSAWGTCQNLTGLDLAIGGEATNAYGVQLALVRNKVLDTAGALQVAIGANSASILSGVQVGLYNDALIAKGLQLGLANVSSDVRGFQIGLLNTTDIIYGYQIGLINVIKGSKVPFFPFINFMFSEE